MRLPPFDRRVELRGAGESRPRHRGPSAQRAVERARDRTVRSGGLVRDRKAPGEGAPVRAAIDMDAPAGLIFTSGSTGRPKGVVATQRAYLEYLQEYANAHRIGPDDVLLSVATLSAAGARECLAAATTGAPPADRLALPPIVPPPTRFAGRRHRFPRSHRPPEDEVER